VNVAVCTRHAGTHAGTGADQVVTRGYAALQRHDPANRYFPYHERVGRWGRGSAWRSGAAALLSDFVLKPLTVPLWARLRKIDVFLHLAPPCIYTERRIPQVCYVYDVPKGEDNRRPLHRWFNRLVVRRSALRADHVITLSQVSRDDIVRSFGIPPERVTVVYPCLDLAEFRPRDEDPELSAFLSRRGLSRGYVLGVISRLVERKNPAAYLEAYARLPAEARRRHKLVLRGPESLEAFRGFAQQATLAAVREDAVLTERLRDSAELALLYAGAGAVLFPSRHEGFGLPVVEAMACGAPVVASNIPVLKEVSGGVMPLFDPADYAGIATHLARVLADPRHRAELRSAGLARSRAFSYEAFAGKIAEVLRAVAGGEAEPDFSRRRGGRGERGKP
jgi:glycosyltransferase involved in cell wall biosynthesis